ncbi:hypothetical protein PFISCL1PPCAC_26708, partial [Pristionchus fissidentatus]
QTDLTAPAKKAKCSLNEITISHLPFDVITSLFPFISSKDRSHFGQICKTLHAIELDFGKREYGKVAVQFVSAKTFTHQSISCRVKDRVFEI